MAGFSQGGGIGLTVARWIVEGEPGMDVFAMDVSRFGDFANTAYVRGKTRENYQRRFILPFWNEELAGGAAIAHLADLRSTWRRRVRCSECPPPTRCLYGLPVRREAAHEDAFVSPLHGL